jgi:hypothetical protein
MGMVPVRLVTKCRVLPAQSPSSTLCNGHTTLVDQQPHVSLAHPAEERPQPDAMRTVRLVTKRPMCNGHTALGDQQPHVSLAHPTEERPQPDGQCPRETGDEMSCVAGSISLLHPVYSTLCNGHTTLGDQQPHVSLAHPTEERPQPDGQCPRETGDEMLCVAGSISLLPVCVMATRH